MSGETEEYFAQLCKRSLGKFFRNKAEYEKMIERGAQHDTTASGEEFTKRRMEAYIQRNCKAAKDLFYEGNQIYAVLMSARDSTAVLVRDGFEEKTILSKWKEMYREEPANMSFAGTFYVDTRDGEKLSTDVYLPEEGGMTDKKIPAVLVRTPYGKKKGVEIYYRFVQRAAAASGNPHLKAMLSSVCAGSAFGDLPRRGGCFTSGILAWAFAMAEQKIDRDKMVRGDWDAVLDMRPLEEIPQKADKRKLTEKELSGKFDYGDWGIWI